jgi:Rod binding domain-containing protein
MQAIAATRATMDDPKAAIPQPRLINAAHEFEAQMIQELLKPLAAMDALTGEEQGPEGDTGSNGALGEFATEALGQALSQHGGFGIASRILHDLSHSNTRHQSGKVTGNLHSDTVMSVSK